MNDLDGASFSWVSAATDQRSAATLFARISQEATAYISHSEIQDGLSTDGLTWAADAKERSENWLRSLDLNGPYAVAVSKKGETIIAVAVLDWTPIQQMGWCALVDFVVAADQRGGGIGAAMLDFVEQEAIRRGARWVFLESGERNDRAHEFFERCGFAQVSVTMAKRLGAIRN